MKSQSGVETQVAQRSEVAGNYLQARGYFLVDRIAVVEHLKAGNVAQAGKAAVRMPFDGFCTVFRSLQMVSVFNDHQMRLPNPDIYDHAVNSGNYGGRLGVMAHVMLGEELPKPPRAPEKSASVETSN